MTTLHTVRKCESHRVANGCGTPKVYHFGSPFSSFEFLEHNFNRVGTAVRRCFSLARSFKCQTFVVESVLPAGMILDENTRLNSLNCSSGEYVYRFSFWRKEFSNIEDIAQCADDDLIGYAIVKHDFGTIEGQPKDVWYVFESVFVKYNHDHNCVIGEPYYLVRVADSFFAIRGVLYCQQNSITKVCAHVALRSLLSRCSTDGDVNYETLHSILSASTTCDHPYLPWRGLSSRQIQDVLTGLNIAFNAFDYYEVEQHDPTRAIERQRHPYQSYVYSGVESGMGALLGFKILGPNGRLIGKHIIPFYGHTFNKDTWVPDAETAYFMITQGFGYKRSENWVSSFIGHDDNFGPNYCVPRTYMKPEQVDYVVAIQRPGVVTHSRDAEVAALSILTESMRRYAGSDDWSRRLLDALPGGRNACNVVLRTVCMKSDDYLAHLRSVTDWCGNHEDTRILEAVRTAHSLREVLVVEASMAQLFPANERKLAEVVFPADHALTRDDRFLGDFKFDMVRFPRTYLVNFPDSKGVNGFNLLRGHSNFTSHLPVIKQ